ncbi:helix-turn-helix domain-containing protein [Chryseobacterium jejuense]|uniref:Helix-turn-helix domain-containing protein n=1 Tax=Chryseobacterium jejuense TaxID=445960 RepID=A0A2X2VT72_CHRJE|nr:helix-turn-helix transcriptional regulator [Chryseobacterium jejuense]SDI25776.1 Helix-turn-helix domain-containing protein [Chryseobacterium jejuense]SQB26715.1 Methylphosphotriester-DNA--protein-cysteine S-methyltransferase [Chryseobacterium jejuense]
MNKLRLFRTFKNATTLNPIEYIQKVKVEAAKKALETGESNIADITYNIGYSNLKTFRTLFKRVTCLTPIDYKNKYKGNLID